MKNIIYPLIKEETMKIIEISEGIKLPVFREGGAIYYFSPSLEFNGMNIAFGRIKSSQPTHFAYYDFNTRTLNVEGGITFSRAIKTPEMKITTRLDTSRDCASDSHFLFVL